MSDLDKLNNLATEALHLANGNIKKAAPKLAYELTENAKRPLLIALVSDYLERLPSAPFAQPQPVTQAQPQPQPQPQAKPQPHAGRAQPTATPPQPIGRRREGKHRRVAVIGTPSPQAKAGAVRVMKAMAHEIFARKIRGAGMLGNICVHELRTISSSSAVTAGKFLLRSTEDAVEAVALGIMADHCVAADPFDKVANVIPATVAVQAFETAKIMAPQIIAATSTKYANDLIAAAREKPLMIEGDVQQ
jgi:hypothetical protein